MDLPRTRPHQDGPVPRSPEPRHPPTTTYPHPDEHAPGPRPPRPASRRARGSGEPLADSRRLRRRSPLASAANTRPSTGELAPGSRTGRSCRSPELPKGPRRQSAPRTRRPVLLKALQTAPGTSGRAAGRADGGQHQLGRAARRTHQRSRVRCPRAPSRRPALRADVHRGRRRRRSGPPRQEACPGAADVGHHDGEDSTRQWPAGEMAPGWSCVDGVQTLEEEGVVTTTTRARRPPGRAPGAGRHQASARRIRARGGLVGEDDRRQRAGPGPPPRAASPATASRPLPGSIPTA
jgi:hypothetical protein